MLPNDRSVYFNEYSTNNEDMEAKELRIGNLVTSNGFQFKTVKEIMNDGLSFIDDPDLPLSWIRPIPLTEEWLIKFGFTKNRNKFYIGINYGLYSVHRVGDAFDHWYLHHEFDKSKRITSNILYVHQLQNLYFALTGEELTFKDL
jgi:hypothetical protein